MKSYRVTISDARYIPGIGKGPIKKPIVINEKKLAILQTLGFSVNVLGLKTINLSKFPEENQDIKEKIVNSEEVDNLSVVENSQENNEEVLEEESNEEIHEVEDSSENDEEILEDDTEVEDSEEVLEEESNEEIHEEFDIDKLTKKQLRAKLEELNVEYPANANIQTLKDILIKEIK